MFVTRKFWLNKTKFFGRELDPMLRWMQPRSENACWSRIRRSRLAPGWSGGATMLSNVIANAAANGVTTRGAWLIVTGEPCAMCARLIHHAGIESVVVVDGGYAGGRDGIEYLTTNNVKVVFRDGPKDPRLAQP